MGRINIAGWVLAPGAAGQALLLGRSIDKVPFWLIFVPLCVPWLLVYVISFCRVAPCGPGRFAQLLIIAIVWYSCDTLVCELNWLLIPTSHPGTYSAAIPHLLCYGSTASFVVLIGAVRDARNYRASHPEAV